MAARILIAESHVLLSQSLAEALRFDGYDVIRIANASASETLEHTQTMHPAVVLVDLQIGGSPSSTFALIDPLRKAGASVVVIVPERDRRQLETCLEKGAAGVVSRAESFENLVAGVEEAADVATLVPPAARAQLIEELQHQRNEPT